MCIFGTGTVLSQHCMELPQQGEQENRMDFSLRKGTNHTDSNYDRESSLFQFLEKTEEGRGASVVKSMAAQKCSHRDRNGKKNQLLTDTGSSPIKWAK